MLHFVNDRWSIDQAAAWRNRNPWFVGCNFTPAYAVNQLEMWQADSFDLPAVDRELGLAASAGMNAVRVYLHDLLWAGEERGFLDRFHRFLDTAERHGIRTMPVLFDSCWHPEPALGPQPAPMPGIHNSGWVQGPGMAALADATQHGRLEDYVGAVVGHFAPDDRILAWDIWNEPDNGPQVDLCDPSSLSAKGELVRPLLLSAFSWARRAAPTQPLTSAVWLGDWSSPDRLSPLQAAQLDCSDVISFHNYGDSTDFAQRVGWLKRHGRPVLCTEFMARPVGSTLDAILPIAAADDVSAFCWGLVRGKTQTHLPWDSWQTPRLDGADGAWFHDLFDEHHQPHDAAEIELLRRLTMIGPSAPSSLAMSAGWATAAE